MSAYGCQTHHDPGPTFQPRDASAPARSGCGCSYRDRHCHAGPRTKAPNPIFSDCSKAQSPGPNPPNYRPEYPDAFSTRVPEAFNTHRQDGRGSGLVQGVLRSTARIPAAESRRRGLCAAPANVKRSAFPRVISQPVGDAVIWAPRQLRSLNRGHATDDPTIRRYRSNKAHAPLTVDGRADIDDLGNQVCGPSRALRGLVGFLPTKPQANRAGTRHGTDRVRQQPATAVILARRCIPCRSRPCREERATSVRSCRSAQHDDHAIVGRS
jgi:hypothetical protein